MKKSLLLLFSIGVFIICLLFDSSCQRYKKKSEKEDYFTFPILTIDKKNIVPIFDSVVNYWQKYSNDSNKGEMIFLVYSIDSNTDTTYYLDSNKGEFCIMAFENIDNALNEEMLRYSYSGCICYNKHLFFIDKCFRHTNWFFLTRKNIKLRKIQSTADNFPIPDNKWSWRILYNKQGFKLQ
jgi:hypothetical protein